MMDSVLWYVQAYVDASPLDRVVNSALYQRRNGEQVRTAHRAVVAIGSRYR